MTLFQITRPGLMSIGSLTLVLWGCFLSERCLMKQSAAEEYRAMRSMRELRLKRSFAPASLAKPAPAPGVIVSKKIG